MKNVVLITVYTIYSKPYFQGKTFIDSLRMYAKAGSGGQGISKFGGKGGPGGNVYVVGDENATLKKIFSDHPDRRLVATSGKNSRS